MNIKLSLTVISLAALSVMGCTKENTALSKPPGQYQTNTSSTDANGTTTTNKATTDVSVDNNGRKKAVVKKKTTKDPKGLFNKTTTENSEAVMEK